MEIVTSSAADGRFGLLDQLAGSFQSPSASRIQLTSAALADGQALQLKIAAHTTAKQQQARIVRIAIIGDSNGFDEREVRYLCLALMKFPLLVVNVSYIAIFGDLRNQ
jgi:hypothetical protein